MALFFWEINPLPYLLFHWGSRQAYSERTPCGQGKGMGDCSDKIATKWLVVFKYTPGSTNLAGWRMDPLNFEDVFPIQNGDIPASYVSFPDCIWNFQPKNLRKIPILTNIFFKGDWFNHQLEWKARAGWQQAPLGAGHAGLWLRGILKVLGEDHAAVANIGTHSCKATVLSWLAKAGHLLGNTAHFGHAHNARWADTIGLQSWCFEWSP